ncbi:MAG: PDZ domain-containing protein, partial [Clostridia bacterium]|nr:PDZ domain-containing protein [Clostridia bacterium]
MKTLGLALAALWLAAGTLAPVRGFFDMPSQITLYEGESVTVPLGRLGITSTGDGDACAVMRGDNETLGGGVTLNTVTEGETSYSVSVFGIPVRSVKVSVRPDRALLPGGECVGVGLHLRGVLVVGLADVIGPEGAPQNPAAAAGIQPGDEIEAVNGTPVTGAENFIQMLSEGETFTLSLRRGRRKSEATVQL